MKPPEFVPVNIPSLDGNEKKYLAECIDSGWISSEGPFVKQFEGEMASSVGRKHGIAVVNGTVALELAAIAIGIKPGDEVILPTFTIISCAAAIIRCGAKPVLVDSDPLTWNMDVKQVEQKISKLTKAIMVVHIYGLPVDMDPIFELARRFNLYVIEDVAEAIGQKYHDKSCGNLGDISAYSFYPNKHITTGEGGMLLTSNSEWDQRLRSLRNLCFIPGNRFVHEELGFNYRMTNLQAAVGVAQFEKLPGAIKKKRTTGQTYGRLLGHLSTFQFPADKTPFAENIYWVYGLVIRADLKSTAKEAIAFLAEEGIEARPFFWPMHEQPILKKMGLFNGEKYPVAEHLARKGFYIPTGTGISEEQVSIVVDKVQKLSVHIHG